MKKILITSFIIFIIVIFLGFIYINNVYIPKNLKPMVVNLLEKNLGKDVSIENAVYFPFKGVVFSGISIVNKDGTPFFGVDKVDFALKSFPRIKKGEISAKIRLVIRGMHLMQQELQLRGGSILDMDIDIKEKNELFLFGTIKLNNLEIQGIKPLAGIKKISGTINCRENNFLSEDISAMIGKHPLRIVFSGEYDKDSVLLEKFDAAYMDTKLSIKGKLSNFSSPKIETSVDGLLNLKDIAGIIPDIPLPRLLGECVFSAKAMGSPADLNSLNAEAKVSLKKGAVEKIKFSDLNAELELNQGQINLSSAGCNFYQGAINAAAKLKITSADIPSECFLEAKDIEIEPLVKDIIGQDMGSGILNAHVEVSGGAVDPNTFIGSGWFKIIEGQLRMPPNFQKVANSLGVQQLADMDIEQVSATFTIKDGKLDTQDMTMVADEATITGKGYIDLEQYIDFEALLKLSQEFVQNSGGVANLLSFVSDESGAPLAKVKVYDRLSQLKYKIVPLPVGDIIKTKVKQDLKDAIKGILTPNEEQAEPEKDDLKEQLKEGLRKLFK